MKSQRVFRALTGGALTAAILVGPALTQAAEPAAQFLEALRQKGYHDIAVDYLETLATSKLVPVEVKETVQYEQGMTLIAMSRLERDSKMRDQRLDEAQAKFQAFINDHSAHPLAAQAKNQMGNVMVERARGSLIEAEKPSNASRKDALMAVAKDNFTKAEKAFKDTQTEIAAVLPTFPATMDEKKDAAKIAIRDQLRADYIQAQLVEATIIYEMAATEPTPEAQTATLKRAADAYGVVYEKYRRRLAGLYARLYQGRCHQDMGNFKDALSFYAELFAQPDEPDPFRVLKTRTFRQATECWLASEPPMYDLVMEKAGEWINKMRPNETTDPDWLQLRLMVAKAAVLKATPMSAKDKGRDVLIKAARDLAEDIAKYPGDTQKEARDLLANLPGANAGTNGEKPQPKTFKEAYDLGKDSLTAMQDAQVMINVLKPKLAQTTDAERKAEMEEQIKEAEKKIEDGEFDAREYFRAALGLVDAESPDEDVNSARYFLSYLYYTKGDIFPAALLGEYVARHHPESGGARQCAKIALASYVKMYKDNTTDDKDFEVHRIVDIADYIARQWPDQAEADEALITLINFMIQQSQEDPSKLDEAEKYLHKIKENSPRRGEAELKTGQAMWSSYLSGMQDVRRWESGDVAPPPGTDLSARKAALEATKSRAQKTLRDGIDRMKQEPPNTTLALAVLSLGQIYVDTSQFPLAIELLEDPDIGAISLVKKNDASVNRPGFAEEAYKTALRAYIGGLQAAADPAAMMAKAQGAMDELNKMVGNSPAGKEKLIAIYISLAQQLKASMEIATPEEKKALSGGFEQFLARVGENTNEFNVLNWVAETFFSLGEGYDTTPGKLTPEAFGYYTKAVAAYDKILKQATTDKAITDQMKTQVLLRSATVKRRLGVYKEAMDAFAAILAEKNMMVSVQVEAAQSYQQWAAANPDPKYTSLFLNAVRGGRKDEKSGDNVIWGWNRLSSIIARQMAKSDEERQKYHGVFHEARYNMAECHYNYSQRQEKGSADREKFLKYAKEDVTYTARSYPDLGGEVWKPKYDQLLRKIQTSLGEPPVGLAALEQKVTQK